MGHPRIAENLYGKPWLIKPSVHQAIEASLASIAKGELPPSDLDEEEYEEEEVYNSGGVTSQSRVSSTVSIRGKYHKLFGESIVG